MSEAKVLHEWPGYDNADRRVVGDDLDAWYESTFAGQWMKDQCGQDENAARELARLAAENARMREERDALLTANDVNTLTIKRRGARIARLEGALRKIVEPSDLALKDEWKQLIWCQGIARAALEAEVPGE